MRLQELIDEATMFAGEKARDLEVVVLSPSNEARYMPIKGIGFVGIPGPFKLFLKLEEGVFKL